MLRRFHSYRQIGEVVPAREGLRPDLDQRPHQRPGIGEVVPAREGLRRCCISICLSMSYNRRSGSSKRRIKTKQPESYQ